MIITGLTGSGVDNHLARWDGTGALQSSAGILDDSGNLTGLTSVVLGNTTYSNIDAISSTATFDITASGTMTFNSGTGDFNMIAFLGAINAAAQLDVNFFSNTGNVILGAALAGSFTANGGDLTLESTNNNINLNANGGGIVTNTDFLSGGAVVLGANSILLGASNNGSISHDGTALIIRPNALTSTNEVVIGSASTSLTGPDANLRLLRLGLFGSDTSGTSAINLVITGALRTALNFSLTLNSGTIASPLVCNLIDTSTGNNIIMASTFEYTLNNNNHSATDATKASVINISTGINAAITLTTGTNHYFTCLKLVPNGKGVGGSHSVNLFSTGLFQKKMTAFTTSGTQTLVGSYWGDDVCIEQNTKLFFDSTETDSVTYVAVTKGTTSLSYVSASSLLRTTVAGTNVWDQLAASNNSLVDLKLTTVGTGLYVKEGTNATMGIATLVGGTKVVATTKVTANSRIFITSEAPGGTIGFLSVSARTAGTSFTILSSNILDTSNVAWVILEPS